MEMNDESWTSWWWPAGLPSSDEIGSLVRNHELLAGLNARGHVHLHHLALWGLHLDRHTLAAARGACDGLWKEWTNNK
jgi:hypothetical protein